MTNRQEIERAISALEAHRPNLGDAVAGLSIAALRQQLHQLEAQAAANSALRGERKQVTVMFADISGFTAMSEKLDPEEVRNMINNCFARLGAVIDRYDGHIDKFIGDEIMALFGAPVAHENDPERALRAALDMMVALEEFNREHAHQLPKPLALHFGVNSGLVIAGGIGTNQRQDYSVMGDTVNLAARLEDLSEAGQILVGEDTYRLTAPLFEFEAMPPVMVKGKEQPVQVYCLLKARAAAGGQVRGIAGLSSPLVGRAAEYNTLKQAVTNLCQGQGGVVSVVGEAGLGKSRLVSELAPGCPDGTALAWAGGRALSYGDSASFLVARDVLRSMLAIDMETAPPAASQALRTEVERLFSDHQAELFPYLAYLLELPLDEEAMQRIKYLSGDALHQQIFQSVQTFILARIQKMPLVLVWEDLHWADPSSLALLETLLPLTGQGSLLLLLVYRRPIQDSKIWRFHRHLAEDFDQDFPVIELAPLTSDESGQLLDNLLGPQALPANVKQLIINKAEGNPFYLEEVIRSLIHTGAITRASDDQGWQATPGLSDIRLPDSLQGIIMARIDQLDLETKRIVQIASVIGRNFPYQLLAQVLGRLETTPHIEP